MMDKKIAIILGTRPEIIKLSPIIRLFEKKGLDYFIVHTGQHYSERMSKLFFKELLLPNPKYNLVVGSGSHGQQTGLALIEIEKVLLKENPQMVIVQGDTNSTVAGALAASKLHMKTIHVEAGLRSFDKKMPEEINRIVADHVSDQLFAPTNNCMKNLLKEGISKNKIAIVGNTIADAIDMYASKVNGKIMETLTIESKNYILLTLHRQENTDSKQRLEDIMKGIELVFKDHGFPIIWPIHPRTKKKLAEFNLKIPEGITLTQPIGFYDFLDLEKNARLVLTDSGGIQEETCILSVPCVTLRQNTERPETLEVGSNVLSGTNPKEIQNKSKVMLKRNCAWIHPFGKNSAKKIFKYLENAV